MLGGGFGNIFKIPELKKRILYTLGLLIVYRIGVHVPTPGIDSVALASFFAQAKMKMSIDIHMAFVTLIARQKRKKLLNKVANHPKEFRLEHCGPYLEHRP